MNPNLLDGLFTQLRARGIAIVYEGDDKLKLTGNTKDADAKVMAALKAFRPHILARLKAEAEQPKPAPVCLRPEWETCRVCRSNVSRLMTESDADTLCYSEPRCPYRSKPR